MDEVTNHGILSKKTCLYQIPRMRCANQLAMELSHQNMACDHIVMDIG